MASFVPWALLVLAIILFKKNRTAKSLLILIPIAISCLVWLLFKLTFSVPSSQAAIFDMMLLSFVIGLAILCLWAHKRSRRNRFGTLLLAVAVVSIVSIVSSLPFYSFILSSEVIIWIIFLELVIFAAAAAVILTCFKCRKDYSPVRFVLWLALWSVISCLTVMFLYAGVIIMSGGIPTEQFLNLLKELFIVGLVIGALLYLIMLPFVIMLMNSGFFRWPFFECFRLKGMVLSPSERDRAGLPPQSQTPSAETNQSDDWRK